MRYDEERAYAVVRSFLEKRLGRAVTDEEIRAWSAGVAPLGRALIEAAARGRPREKP